MTERYQEIKDRWPELDDEAKEYRTTLDGILSNFINSGRKSVLLFREEIGPTVQEVIIDAEPNQYIENIDSKVFASITARFLLDNGLLPNRTKEEDYDFYEEGKDLVVYDVFKTENPQIEFVRRTYFRGSSAKPYIRSWEAVRKSRPDFREKAI